MAYVLPEYEKQNTVKQPVKDNGGGGLRIGSSGEDVKKLQNALIDKGYDLGTYGADGQFGEKTAAAVRKYQTDNKLQVDGIAGSETLGHLYGNSYSGGDSGENAAPAEPTPLQKAQALLDQQNQSKPSYEKLWDEQMNGLVDEYTNRDKFSYDVNQDPLYRQLQDQYVAQGQLAMMDAQGQASALAGGYGSSYGQMVGQQTYQGYLQQITDKIPQLYELARANYDAEGQELLNKFSLIGAMSDREYNRYMDELNIWLSERNYLQGVVDTERNWEYNQQQTEYGKLSQLLSMGYNPTDDELLAAGMTRGQANTIRDTYLSSRYSGSPATKTEEDDKPVKLPQIDYTRLGFTGGAQEANEKWTELYKTPNASGQYGESLWNELSYYVGANDMSAEQAESIMGAYLKIYGIGK